MYTIDEKKFATVEEVAKYIIDTTDLTREYDDMLDECYDDISICGLTYAPSDALRRVDKVAYDCGYSDFLDTIYCDVVYDYDLEYMSTGDTLTLYEYEVVYTDEEEEGQE